MSAITKETVTLAGHHSVASLKNILFATDFSAPSMKAFPYVTALAKKFGASVFACHVITPTSLVAAAPQAASYVYEAEHNAATKELEFSGVEGTKHPGAVVIRHSGRCSAG
jgi:nucleotide-binding universal stress UspA family protein